MLSFAPTLTTCVKFIPSRSALCFHRHKRFSLSCFARGISTIMSCSSTTFVTERAADRTITVSPRQEDKQSALVVISHGLGDTSEGFVDVAEQLCKAMPWTKFILPTAPTQPVTLNMGMAMPSWYDIVGLDERSNEQCKGIDQSQARIKAILEAQHVETGLPFHRMVLMGFSQGGALSLYTGLQLNSPLAGIVCLSGYLPHAKGFDLKQTEVPVFHGHGTLDPVVLYSMATKSKELVTSKGLKSYTLKQYTMQHTVSMEEITDVLEFLVSRLPDNEKYRIRIKDPSQMSLKELRAAIRKAGLESQTIGFMEKQDFVKLLLDHRSGK